MSESFQYDVFLSHNSAQKDWTRDLARRLRDDGFKVWFDEWVLPKEAGKNWITQLRDGVKASHKTILVWSPDFFTHDWPTFESTVIQLTDPGGRKDRVIPLLHTACKIPDDWAFRQSLDFTSARVGTVEFDFHYQQLVHNLDPSRPYEGDIQRFKETRIGVASLSASVSLGPVPHSSAHLDPHASVQPTSIAGDSTPATAVRPQTRGNKIAYLILGLLVISTIAIGSWFLLRGHEHRPNFQMAGPTVKVPPALVFMGQPTTPSSLGGESKPTVKSAEQLVAAHPHDAHTLSDAGNIIASYGDSQRGGELLSQAHNLAPDDAIVRTYLINRNHTK